MSWGTQVARSGRPATAGGRREPPTYHYYDYFYDDVLHPKDNGNFDNGFITGLAFEVLPKYYQSIQDFLNEHSWDESVR